MDDIQECIRVIPETGHFIRVDFPSFVEADLNKKGDRMETTEYVVEIKCYQNVGRGKLINNTVKKKKITVHEISEAQARSKAINHGMELHPEIYDVEVVSIKKGQ